MVEAGHMGEKGNVVAAAEVGGESFGEQTLAVAVGIGEQAGETLQDKVIETAVDHGIDETRERLRRDDKAPRDKADGEDGSEPTL
jgi:hypothetical protein